MAFTTLEWVFTPRFDLKYKWNLKSHASVRSFILICFFIHTIRWWWWFLWVFPYVKLNLNLFTAALFSFPTHAIDFVIFFKANFCLSPWYCLQGKWKSSDLSKGWAVSGNENTSLETWTHLNVNFFCCFLCLFRYLSALSQTCRAALWISSSASWGKRITLY